jgi:hypothetical protein
MMPSIGCSFERLAAEVAAIAEISITVFDSQRLLYAIAAPSIRAKGSARG